MLTKAYFVEPTGKLLDIGTRKHIQHITSFPEKFGFTKSELQAIYDRHGERYSQEGRAREEIVKDTVKRGFIHIRNFPRAGWRVTVNRMDSATKRKLVKWAEYIIDNKIDRHGNVGVYLLSQDRILPSMTVQDIYYEMFNESSEYEISRDEMSLLEIYMMENFEFGVVESAAEFDDFPVHLIPESTSDEMVSKKKTLKEFILMNERFINLFQRDKEKRMEYVDDVWEILQKSYAPIGGIKGSGFGSKEEMISRLPFWKLVRRNGKIVAVGIYKDKSGRKFVAGGTDGSREGKDGLIDILKSDLKQRRSYVEVSGPLLSLLKKVIGVNDLKSFAMTPEEFESVSGDSVSDVPENDSEVNRHPELADYFYQRKLGGHMHTKIALGTPMKRIT